MTAGGVIFVAGMVLTLGTIGATILLAFHASQETINKVAYSRAIAIGLCTGLALLAWGGVTMMIELSNAGEVYVECVADQSALAGVCVPVDQAG